MYEITREWHLEIALCANAETLLDGRRQEFEGFEDEAVGHACYSAIHAIRKAFDEPLMVVEENASFRDWHGGTCYRAPIQCGGRVVAWLFRSIPEFDAELGELEFTEPDYCNPKDYPPMIRWVVQQLCNLASDAMGDALDRYAAKLATEPS